MGKYEKAFKAGYGKPLKKKAPQRQSSGGSRSGGSSGSGGRSRHSDGNLGYGGDRSYHGPNLATTDKNRIVTVAFLAVTAPAKKATR